MYSGGKLVALGLTVIFIVICIAAILVSLVTEVPDQGSSSDADASDNSEAAGLEGEGDQSGNLDRNRDQDRTNQGVEHLRSGAFIILS